MTLTKFLLARIAEDEAVGQKVAALADCVETGRELSDPVMISGSLASLAVRSDRWLAECEAKRQIVSMHEQVSNYCVACDALDYDGPCKTIRCLALPYADHPDYQQEWAA